MAWIGVETDGLLQVGDRLLLPALYAQGTPEVGVAHGGHLRVVEPKGLLEVVDGLVQSTLLGQGSAEVGVRSKRNRGSMLTACSKWPMASSSPALKLQDDAQVLKMGHERTWGRAGGLPQSALPASFLRPRLNSSGVLSPL